jgi:hypothetical protein
LLVRSRAGLKSTHEGKKVQRRHGRLRVVDGPFTESKELIGGYALVEVESEREALDAGTSRGVTLCAGRTY